MRLSLLFTLAFIALTTHAQNPIKLNQIYISSSTSYEFLRENGFKPRKDLSPWPVSIPFEWDADPFNDRNWRFQLHAWRIIDPILLKYRETKDRKYLLEAIEIIKDWHQYHFTLKKESKFEWYDMATGIRAMKLAWLWNEVEFNDLIDGKEQRLIFYDLMQQHVSKLMDKSLLSKGNHAYFQLVGLRLLCQSEPTLRLCNKEGVYNDNEMNDLLSRQFSNEGVHRENATYYHIFTLNVLKKLKVSSLYGDEISSLFQKAEQILPWLVYPDGTVARVGDSSGKTKKTASPNSTIYTVNGQSLVIGDYIKSGYFSLRTPFNFESNKSTQIFITGTSNIDAISHKHADELSFELFHRGELIILDSGKYSYNSNEYRDYVLSASAHNTLSFADHRIAPDDVTGPDSKLLSFEIKENIVQVKGELSRPEMFEHSRDFKIMPFEEIRIKDTFKKTVPFYKQIFSSDDTSITSNLHINPLMKINKLSGNLVQLGELATVELDSDFCKLEIINAQKEPLLGWVSFKYNSIEPTSVLRAYCSDYKEGELEWIIKLL